MKVHKTFKKDIPYVLRHNYARDVINNLRSVVLINLLAKTVFNTFKDVTVVHDTQSKEHLFLFTKRCTYKK